MQCLGVWKTVAILTSGYGPMVTGMAEDTFQLVMTR